MRPPAERTRHRQLLPFALALAVAALQVVAIAQTAPPAPEQVRPGVYKPGSGVTAPVLKSKVDPKYTDAALRAKLHGEVWLDVVVRPDGRVGDIAVKKSLDTVNGLDDAAIAAARQWRFEPARLSGQPVAVEVTLILEFRQYRDWPRDPRIFPPGPQSDASFLAGTVAAGAAGVVAPVLERGADPVPSQAARQLGYKGAVRIEAVVDATGRVARVRLVGSGHPLLVDAALVAAFEHVFRPGQAKGVAVPMVVVLELEFR